MVRPSSLLRTAAKLAACAAFAVYAADVAHIYNYLLTYYDFLNEPEDDKDETMVPYLETDARMISADEFAQALQELDACLVPDYGLFTGPDDPALKILREAALGLAGSRAVAMQLAHSFIAKGILLHSNVFTNPYDRAEKTQRFTTGMLYGTKAEIMAAARDVRGLHHKVKGEMGPGSVFPADMRFDASAVHALRWVASTLPETAVYASGLLLPKELDQRDKDALVEMSRKFLLCFGVRDGFKTWDELRCYQKVALKHESMLGASEQANDVIDALAYPAFAVLRPLSRLGKWFTFVQLPPRLGTGFNGGLAMTKFDTFMFALMLARIRFLYRLLPTWVRWVTPYHRLCARFQQPSALKLWVTETIGALSDKLLVLMLPERDGALVKAWVEENRRLRKA